MSKSEEKLRIFELFRKGISVTDVAKTSKTPERTLYRWYKEFEANQIINPIKDAVREVRVELDSGLNEIDFSQDWLKVIASNSIKGCLINCKIREKLSSILLNQLDEPDLNFRAIAALSSSINIHSRLERDFGLYYLLDPNAAMQKLTSEGYEVIDPSEPIPTTTTP